MKYCIAFILIFSATAFAAENANTVFGRGTTYLEDSDIGEVRVVSADSGHTWDELTVHVKCNKRKETAVEPDWELIPRLDRLRICFSSPEKHVIDNAKVLYISHSKLLIPDKGPLGCVDPEYARFDLKRFCAHWRN